MRVATVLTSSLAVLPFPAASYRNHVPGVPRLWGRSGLKDLEARGVIQRHRQRSIENAINRWVPTITEDEHLEPDRIEERQAANTGGQCGEGYGSCAAGYCCSPAVRIGQFTVLRLY